MHRCSPLLPSSLSLSSSSLYCLLFNIPRAKTVINNKHLVCAPSFKHSRSKKAVLAMLKYMKFWSHVRFSRPQKMKPEGAEARVFLRCALCATDFHDSFKLTYFPHSIIFHPYPNFLHFHSLLKK